MADDSGPDAKSKPAGRKPRGRSMVSQTDLAKVFRAGKQEGVKVEVIYPGFRVVMNGSSVPDEEANEWDSVL